MNKVFHGWYLLGTWMWRRLVSRIKFAFEFTRLFIDWTVVVYIIVPGIAFAVYEGIHYYKGLWTAGMTWDTAIIRHIPFSLLIEIGLIMLFVFTHLSYYGNIPHSLSSGDRLYLHLSPIRKRDIYLALWIECWVTAFSGLAAALALAWPVLRLSQTPWWLWLIQIALFATYETAVRLASQLWKDQVQSTWIAWLWFELRRWITLVPVLFGATLPLATFPHIHQHWALFAITCFFVLIVTMLSSWYVLQKPWDVYYRYRANPLVNFTIPAQSETGTEIQFRMRRVSAWSVRQSERVKRRPFSPAIWFLLLRGMRRKGTFRDLFMMTVAASSVPHIAPLFWVKVVADVFCAVLLFQWWSLVVTPLYERPVSEQYLADAWALRVHVFNFRMRFTALIIGLWIVLGFVA